MIQEHHTGSFSDRSSVFVHVADLWSVIQTMPTRVPPKIYAALLEIRICPRSDMALDQAIKLGKQVDQEVQALMSA
jgi:hypothetical protein